MVYFLPLLCPPLPSPLCALPPLSVPSLPSLCSPSLLCALPTLSVPRPPPHLTSTHHPSHCPPSSPPIIFSHYDPFSISSDWSLKTLFGKVVKSACPLATTSAVHVARQCLSSGLSFTVDPPPHVESAIEGWYTYNATST